MATSRINIVDSFFHHAEHEIINTSLLLMVATNHQCIHYYGSMSSINNVKKLLTEQKKTDILNNVTFKIIKLPAPSAKDIYRNSISALYNIWFTLTLSNRHLTIFNYNNYLSGHLVNLISRLFSKSLIICCHAEIEMLSSAIPNGKIALKQRLLNHLFRKNRWSSHLKFLVFGDSIAANLNRILKDEEKYNKILSIDHPYFSSYENAGLTNQSSNIKIGVVGVIKKEKGLQNLLEIASSLQREIKKKSLDIITVSKVVGDTVALQTLGITIYNVGGKLLSREEYSQVISSVDFVYFPYDSNGYRLTASGAVFESIFSEKPIIALQNDFFKYLFDKYGAFGILCESNSDLTKQINSIISGDIKAEDFISNIRRIKTVLKPEFVSLSFRSQLELHYPELKAL